MSTNQGSAEDVASWRLDVLEAMLRVLAIAGPTIWVVTLVMRDPPRFDSTVLIQGAAVALLVALHFAHSVAFRLRAGLAIGLTHLGCFLWIARGGASIGATAGVVAAIVLAVMLLGRTVGLLMLLGTGAGIALIGFGLRAGYFGIRTSDTDPMFLVNWIRWAVSFTLLAGSLAVAVGYVVRHVEAKYAELSTAYGELAGLHRRLESAKEEERRSIARELHDDFGQSLTVLKLVLKTGKSSPFSDPIRVVDSLIVKVRELSRALRPSLLDEMGLAPALGAYIEEQSSVSGVVMDLDAKGFEGRLPGDLEIACFRIVQEAITNALRHAEPRRITVHMERDASAARLVIEDDGRGFAGLPALVQAAIQGHVGIIGMRERVRAFQGTFQIRSQPGKGTTIEVELPLASGDSLSRASRGAEPA